MKLVELLNKSDRQAIASWYDTPSHKAIVKLVEAARLEWAKSSLEAWQQDDKQRAYVAGKAASLKELFGLIKDVAKSEESKD